MKRLIQIIKRLFSPNEVEYTIFLRSGEFFTVDNIKYINGRYFCHKGENDELEIPETSVNYIRTEY